MRFPSLVESSIPADIRGLQHFGIGEFSDGDIGDKCNEIRKYLEFNIQQNQRNPDASIVVPAHKEERYILATLLSLARQTHDRYEVVLVVNGEAAGSKTQKICEAAGFDVIHEQKGGYGHAMNVGLHNARGEVILTTDADTVHSPNWVSVVMNASKKSGYIASKADVAFTEIHPLLRLYRLAKGHDWKYKTDAGQKSQRTVFGANSHFLRDEAISAGGYETNWGSTTDLEIFKRILPDGGEIFIDHPDALVYSSARSENREFLTAFDQKYSLQNLLPAFDSSSSRNQR